MDLNVRIAKALGWSDFKPAKSATRTSQWTGIVPMTEEYKGVESPRTYIPNWSGDLNLMHKLEEMLITYDSAYPNAGYWEEYCERLAEITGGSVGANIHATAAQKAEAFLKVKEKT